MSATIAVLLPCHNEAAAIGRVVTGFRSSLPTATVYVYDNLSTDDTAQQARAAGAVVVHSPRKGKGNVVRSMFADIDADVYVMADGDGTYDASVAAELVDQLLTQRLDMVVGIRDAAPDDDGVYPPGHVFGNALFSSGVQWVFGEKFSDVLSGYRVMSRRFVKSLPVMSSGFEIETELSAHAVRVLASSAEVSTAYRSREEGSSSSLRTYRDGLRILLTIVRLCEEMRPLLFYGVIGALLTAVALGLGIPLIIEFRRTGLVPRFPTAILAAALQTIAFTCLLAGVILRRVSHAQNDARRLTYLQIPHAGAALEQQRS